MAQKLNLHGLGLLDGIAAYRHAVWKLMEITVHELARHSIFKSNVNFSPNI